MRRALALAALALGLLAAPAIAAADDGPRTPGTELVAVIPQTSLSDVEDEVMCPICGTLLELADSPQARRQKVYVKRLIAAGETKAEIKDALVEQYGRAVLATPKATGFDLTAYLVPVLAILAAAAALAFSVARWRRQGKDSPGKQAPEAPRGEDAQRLDDDLSRYDL